MKSLIQNSYEQRSEWKPSESDFHPLFSFPLWLQTKLQQKHHKTEEDLILIMFIMLW